MDELNQMEYLKQMENIKTTIVFDGKKVRIGFHGEAIEPFREKYAPLLEQIKQMAVQKVLEARDGTKTIKNEETFFDFNITLKQKLHKILGSSNPLLVELFKGLTMNANMKIHEKQSERLLFT